MSVEQNPEYSLFARTLKDLMDETGLFDRRMWAALLGVTDETVNQWITDKAIPTSERLWVLVDVLRGSDLKNEEPLSQYEKIASLPTTEVSPFGRFMLPTLSDYADRQMLGSTPQGGYPWELKK